ncbi:Rhodanese-like domain-containing protein [Russula vinacea]|nr:Rhodanese-like domain-containing protein [Russula vinacea]
MFFTFHALASVRLPRACSALQQLRSSADVNILDASWFMPNTPRDASKEFIEKRIPGARYLDLDEVAAPSELGFKHMMPSAQVKFGITPTSHVVLYDSHGIFSAPRALFMFRSFGHEQSSVLDGGLPGWVSEGLPTEAGPVVGIPRAHTQIRSYDQMVSNAAKELSDPLADIVLDARAHGRYTGSDPEPTGLPSGHMPHSFSLPFSAFLRTNSGRHSGAAFTTFLPPDELRRKLDDAVGTEYAQLILEGQRSVTTTCGSGMTACILWLGLKLINETASVALYDESWMGYASRPQSKIDKYVR